MNKFRINKRGNLFWVSIFNDYSNSYMRLMGFHSKEAALDYVGSYND